MDRVDDYLTQERSISSLHLPFSTLEIQKQHCFLTDLDSRECPCNSVWSGRCKQEPPGWDFRKAFLSAQTWKAQLVPLSLPLSSFWVRKLEACQSLQRFGDQEGTRGRWRLRSMALALSQSSVFFSVSQENTWPSTLRIILWVNACGIYLHQL